MGRALFQLFRRKGYPVTVVCRTPEGAAEAQRVCLKRNRASISQPDDGRWVEGEAYRFGHEPAMLEDAALVIESVTERLAVKQEILAKIEKVVSNEALLLTNTSSISINKMASVLQNPQRFCGLHFFYPLPLIDLVEIVRGDATSPAVVERLAHFAAVLNKKPVVVRDGPGSVINGILVHYYAEAAYLLEEGAALPSAVDRAARRHFYVGPCESIDTIGIELFLDGLENAPEPGTPSVVPIRLVPKGKEHLSNEALGGRKGFYFPPILSRLRQDGRLGKAVGRGLFLYEQGQARDDALAYYFNEDRYGVPRMQRDETDEDRMAHRLFFSVLNGTLWAMGQGFLSPEQADEAVREILQMKTGPVSWMRAQGLTAVEEAFRALVREEGERFQVPVPQEIFHPMGWDGCTGVPESAPTSRLRHWSEDQPRRPL